MYHKKMKLGIFGGTFNPIHYGHLRAAEEVHEVFKLDRTLFIPCGRPPFKKPALIAAHHRYEMTKIAIKGNSNFKVSDIEIIKRGVSYSVDTVRRLADKYRSAEIFFIIGTDTFLDLPRWKKPDELTDTADLVVISRPGSSFADLASSPYLKGISKKTLIQLDKGGRDRLSFNIDKGKKAFLCKVTLLNISASGIRTLIRKGKSIKYLLPDSVESYIIANKLY